MKSSKIKIAALLLASAAVFAGCGDALYELTPEEEVVIAGYAAQAVAKYNGNQQDGEIYVDPKELESEEADTQELAPDVSDTEEGVQEETQKPQQEADGDTERSSEMPNDTATVSEALHLGEVLADYTGSSLCGTYEKSDVYAVDAEPGKQLLVLNFKLSNPTDQDLHIDVLSMTPKIQAVVSEDVTAAAQTTILPHDLSTYQGDLPAGASAECVLLFQVPESVADVSNLDLLISADGGDYTVGL